MILSDAVIAQDGNAYQHSHAREIAPDSLANILPGPPRSHVASPPIPQRVSELRADNARRKDRNRTHDSLLELQESGTIADYLDGVRDEAESVQRFVLAGR